MRPVAGDGRLDRSSRSRPPAGSSSGGSATPRSRRPCSRLPEHYRQVVLWHHDEGLTFEAIAARMGISAEAARKLWGRALVCLKRNLGPDHDPR